MIIAIIVAICAGCGGSSSVDKAIKQVEKALEKVDKNKGKMTEADWKALEKEVEEPLRVLNKALVENKVSVMGRIKVMALVAKCATVMMEAGFTEIEKQTGVQRDNWGRELEKAAKEIEKATKELSKTLADSIKSVSE